MEMTSIARQIMELLCDDNGEDCQATFVGEPGIGVSDVRRLAGRKGWVVQAYGQGVRDLCPYHATHRSGKIEAELQLGVQP
jgi:hypothetical protein